MSDTKQPAPDPKRPHRRSSLGLLASMAAMMGATMPLFAPSSRVDKTAREYVKTPEDLARMARAEAKRERRKSRNGA